MADASTAGIQLLEVGDTSEYGSPPGGLYVEALAERGQDVTACQATAEKLLSLAEKYRQEIYFDQLHVVIVVSQGGEVLYDHSFQVSPPSSTTSSTQQFVTYYSAPRLRVIPREGVSLEVDVSRHQLGTVTLDVKVSNNSTSTFYFRRDDLRLYVNGESLEPTRYGKLTAVIAGSSGATYVDYSPAQFDPHVAGLLYISSDPQSQGFTASDGPVPDAPD